MKKVRSARSSAASPEITEPVIPAENLEVESGFPIVGIGASAGGLEALEQFFSHVPAASGMAFVVVQHLDPTHTSILAELLQHSTEMIVSQVEDRTEVQRDHVYVIPPKADMQLLHGTLRLIKPTTSPGVRLPINSFFRSLADDQQDRSVGIILSGMGTDGTLGLRAIKEQAGLVLVQDPGSAKFDGMPRSAVEAGLADIVATAEELPARLVNYLRHTPTLAPQELATVENPQSELAKVIILLRRHVGHDFSMYKHNTLYRRIERRMGLHQIAKIKNYVEYLGENPQELDLLFKELLIGVTSFFRDVDAWDQLRNEILPTLFKTRKPGQPLRAWVAGCSSGEEAYSLAIVIKEAIDQVKDLGESSLQIFATDLDRDAVHKARQGFYSNAAVADISPERLSRFFIKEQTGYRVTNEIRAMIIFAPQNLIADPPFINLDLLNCRNVLIYFNPELQKKLLPLFHYSLKPGGVLFIGTASSIAGFTDLFVPVVANSRLYWRRETANNRQTVVLPPTITASKLEDSMAIDVKDNPPPNLQIQAEQWLLQRHAPASVLVNTQGDILFISGRTGRYLEPAAGKANWNVLVMAREGLRDQLTSAFERVCQQKETVTIRRLKVDENRLKYFVDLCIQFIEEPGALCGLVMIVFTEVPGSGSASKSRSKKAEPENDRLRELELEVQRGHKELQRTRDEHQASQEELQSVNEEMQSTNEELQSLNEELTTSKEELQSLNEELQTVNAELQAKADDSAAANNDMKNLLDSTEIATVFLDNSLKVRRFTDHANKVIKLIPTDIGRPISDLATGQFYPDLEGDAHKVLRTLVSIEKTLVTHDGRHFATRLMPYRTMDNRIDGVVMTFTDLSLAMKSEVRSRVVDTDKGNAK